MGIQAEASTQENMSIEQQVSAIVSKMVKDDKGTWTFPDTVTDEALKYAAMAERRRRDTQATYTQLDQRNKALEAEKAILMEEALSDVINSLPEDKKETLNDLKYSDPEEWRKQLAKLEQDALSIRKGRIDEKLKEVSEKTYKEVEIARRERVLDQFSRDNPDITIDDNTISNDIPPRILKKLDNGDITFEQFLEDCADYLRSGTTIAKPKAPEITNLGRVSGSSDPKATMTRAESIRSYSTEIY